MEKLTEQAVELLDKDKTKTDEELTNMFKAACYELGVTYYEIAKFSVVQELNDDGTEGNLKQYNALCAHRDTLLEFMRGFSHNQTLPETGFEGIELKERMQKFMEEKNPKSGKEDFKLIGKTSPGNYGNVEVHPNGGIYVRPNTSIVEMFSFFYYCLKDFDVTDEESLYSPVFGLTKHIRLFLRNTVHF